MNKQTMSAPRAGAVETRGARVRAEVAPRRDDVMRRPETTLGRVAPKLTRMANPKIVVPRAPDADPRAIERARMLDVLCAAQGPTAVSRALDALLAAGHAMPDEQEPWLAALEHVDEQRVIEALTALGRLLSSEPPRRRPVLEQRLLRLEAHGELAETRALAATLRRSLGALTPNPPAFGLRAR